MARGGVYGDRRVGAGGHYVFFVSGRSGEFGYRAFIARDEYVAGGWTRADRQRAGFGGGEVQRIVGVLRHAAGGDELMDLSAEIGDVDRTGLIDRNPAAFAEGGGAGGGELAEVGSIGAEDVDDSMGGVGDVDIAAGGAPGVIDGHLNFLGAGEFAQNPILRSPVARALAIDDVGPKGR